mmetsp:Transcript_3287/g.4744  ORF Transcript_3287/g.4744 Transcript_3287/m.4744 type:complete len:492 (+) Transcript_3287:151-1626(+)
MGNSASTNEHDSEDDSSFESGDELSYLEDSSEGSQDDEDYSYDSEDDEDDDSLEYDEDEEEEEVDEKKVQPQQEKASKSATSNSKVTTESAGNINNTVQKHQASVSDATPSNTTKNAVDEMLQNSDLFQLLVDDVAIQKLKSLTRESILVEYRSRRSAIKQTLGASNSSNNNQTTDNMNGNRKFDVAKHAETAMEMLKVCPELNALRFKLVPGRIKEHAFWYTVFAMILSEQYAKKEGTTTTTTALDDNDDDEEQTPEHTPEDQVGLQSSTTTATTSGKGASEDSRKQTRQKSQKSKSMSVEEDKLSSSSSSSIHVQATVQPSSTYSRSYREVMTSGSNAAVLDLHGQLKEKNSELKNMSNDLKKANETINSLQKEILKLQQQQQQQQQRQSSTVSQSNGTNGVGSESSSSLGGTKKHKGKWIMDQDSKDFLELEQEIKENLRQEKERRLKEVRDQMKFILDTDDISHSFGEWDCCNASEYNAEGCTEVDE